MTLFQYEYEKRPASAASGSRVTLSRDWHARRPLPPRPVCEDLPSKTTVPLKVWIIASASCFAVCAVLVLATIVITKWGTTDSYQPREIYAEMPEPVYAPYPIRHKTTTESVKVAETDIDQETLEKLGIFNNFVGRRDKKMEDLISKPQPHPLHDTSLHHVERKIEKKDQAKLLDFKLPHLPIATDSNQENDIKIPAFKPTLPDVFTGAGIKLTDGYFAGFKPEDNYDEYYNDENLYDDYMQSNTMTSYLIEKVQELHDWVTSDPDFEASHKGSRKTSDDFGHLLKALNESIIEGNVTIIMNKLKDIYFGENFTDPNNSRKVILKNNTSLLSFGILTLDVMLLHNIQLMAWESQDSARLKMLKDPDVFAFNALFMEPSKVEAKRNEIYHFYDAAAKRPNRNNDESVEKNLLENVLEIGMSTARAAIHLGRAYKNTRMVLNQLSNKEALNANIQHQISRNIDANTHALHHLQSSYNKNDTASAANTTNGVYTDLDCVWLLYCKNLVATAKLNAPYGTMARINGLALRMLTGEVPADKALDTLLYEVLGGWSELRCIDMFPKCSKANAAGIVLDSILQPLRKTQTTGRLQ